MPAFTISISTPSTLVDLHQETLKEQQRYNSEVTADLTAFIRSREPSGVTVSVGGEIGEVGKKNSTVDELRDVSGYLPGVPATER